MVMRAVVGELSLALVNINVPKNDTFSEVNCVHFVLLLSWKLKKKDEIKIIRLAENVRRNFFKN